MKASHIVPPTTAEPTTETPDDFTREFNEIVRECAGLLIDLVFIADGSSSVTPARFELIKEFLINITRPMDVDPGITQVAMVQYASFPRVEFGFQKTQVDVEASINAVQLAWHRLFVTLCAFEMTRLSSLGDVE